MSLLNLLFPKNCLGCKRQGSYVCSYCVQKVRFQKQICIECEKPAVDGIIHVACRRPHALDRTVSVWRYEGAIRTSILGVKYKFASEMARELAEHAQVFLKENREIFPDKAVLIPIPLTRRRRNWRGFNQASEVGRLVAESMGWSYSKEILFRKFSRRPQTELKEKERKANVRGVFFLNPNYQLQEIDYVVFDDVLTTGATIKEAGKVLKRAGAKSVLGLTLAS